MQYEYRGYHFWYGWDSKILLVCRPGDLLQLTLRTQRDWRANAVRK